MITIKAYKERQYHLSRYGEKLYFDGKDGETALKLAMLTGKMFETEKKLIYTACGETTEEAEKALKNYKKTMSINDDLKLEYHQSNNNG